MLQFRLVHRCKHFKANFFRYLQGIPKHYPDDGNRKLPRNVRISGIIVPVHAMKAYNTVYVQFHAFSTSTLDERSGQLHAPEGWASLDALEKTKPSCSFRESNDDSSVVHPVA
jgi:hypothetical protein